MRAKSLHVKFSSVAAVILEEFHIESSLAHSAGPAGGPGRIAATSAAPRIRKNQPGPFAHYNPEICNSQGLGSALGPFLGAKTAAFPPSKRRATGIVKKCTNARRQPVDTSGQARINCRT
jgi:hypothetical protein